MNILGFNDEEFKEAILNNIENKENINEELLDSIINDSIEEIARNYNGNAKSFENAKIIDKYCLEHTVNKEDFTYLDLDKDSKLIRLNKIDDNGNYFDFLIEGYEISNNEMSWDKLFIKRNGSSEKFEEVKNEGYWYEVIDFNILGESIESELN